MPSNAAKIGIIRKVILRSVLLKIAYGVLNVESAIETKVLSIDCYIDMTPFSHDNHNLCD